MTWSEQISSGRSSDPSTNGIIRGATLDEFVQHCMEAAGPGLERFFADWIYTTEGIHLVMEGKSLQELIHIYQAI